ncbi:MAG: histidinol-phosphate transaminase [Dehalococcoidia bacterium]|nr:histidinol-phosphate transaminase [Dehalococcoidia bacterium]
MKIKDLVRPDLLSMKSYTPIEPVDVLSRRVELPLDRVVKLDGNENPYGCSPEVYAALTCYSDYHIYPDPEQRDLRQALAQYVGFDTKYIVCGSGSDDLIDLVVRLFVGPGDEVINCPPTFGMYPFSAEICGAKVINIDRDSQFVLDVPNVVRVLKNKGKVLFVASPNNPTGNLISEQELVEILNVGKIVVVDEAYFEFSRVTVANLVHSYSNLIVLRTFSKWAGLAGLRVGYSISSPEVADYLMKIKQPYNVNSAAKVAVLASLRDIDYLTANVQKITTERSRLFDKLEGLGWLKPYPSSANFVLCLVLPGQQARDIWLRLQQRGIAIRYFDNPRLKDYLRISVGNSDDTDAVIEALRAEYRRNRT